MITDFSRKSFCIFRGMLIVLSFFKILQNLKSISRFSMESRKSTNPVESDERMNHIFPMRQRYELYSRNGFWSHRRRTDSRTGLHTQHQIAHPEGTDNPVFLGRWKSRKTASPWPAKSTIDYYAPRELIERYQYSTTALEIVLWIRANLVFFSAKSFIKHNWHIYVFVIRLPIPEA